MPPRRLWRLSIVLAFLLVRHSWSASVSTENPVKTENADVDTNSNSNTQTSSNAAKEAEEDEYEVIDVANHKGHDSKTQTGETTRIFTAGEVDEDFWLKHLGEDFKHAIHLQVGGNEHFNELYNMARNGSGPEIHHEYLAQPNPVEHNKAAQRHQQQRQEEKINFGTDKNGTTTSINATANNGTKQEVSLPSDKSEKTGNKTTDTKNETSYEHMFTIDEDGINLSHKLYLNPNSFDLSNDKDNNKHTHYTKTQQHEHHHHTKNQKHTKASGNGVLSSGKLLPPVVVTLPESDKLDHQLEANSVPVVVKMPPVIYHHKPMYTHTHTHPHSQDQHHTQSTQTQSNQGYSTDSSHYTNYLHKSTPYTPYTTNYYNPPPFVEPSYKPSDTTSPDYRFVIRKATPGYSTGPIQLPMESPFESYRRASRSIPDIYV